MYLNYYSCLAISGVNLMFFTAHLPPNIMVGPTIALGVILNPDILHQYIASREHTCNVVVA